jgi:hypothetical protein
VPPSAPAKTRPGWLTTFAITGMAMGIMRIGWAASMMAIPKLLAFQASMLERVPASAIGDLQRETYARMAALSEDFVKTHLGLMVGVVGFAVLLIVSGIGCLKLSARFRLAALVGFLGLMATDAALASDELTYQRDVKDASDRLMNGTVELSGQSASGALHTVSSVSRSMQTTNLYLTVGWMALRVVICAGGFAYLARPATKRLFETSGV